MILKSFSKINLSLSVNRKLKKNRLHEIQSYFCLVNLYDEIKIKKIKDKKDVVRFHKSLARSSLQASRHVVEVSNLCLNN